MVSHVLDIDHTNSLRIADRILDTHTGRVLSSVNLSENVRVVCAWCEVN